MIKLKNPKVDVLKTNEAKGCKTQKQKPKCGELRASCQSDAKGAEWPNKSKQSNSSSKKRFIGRNRQWNNSHVPQRFSPYNLFMPTPCGFYFDMPYFYPSWFSYYSYISRSLKSQSDHPSL